MQNIITFSDLLLFSYDESNASAKARIRDEINFNQALKKQWVKLVYLKNQLDKVQELPSDLVVNELLNYSRAVSSVNTSAGRQLYHIN